MVDSLGCSVARDAPKISYMLFADDSYLFCKSTKEEAVQIRELLHYYELALGHLINYAKSSIFFSTNTQYVGRQEVCSTLNILEAGESSLYLGLPNLMGRNKSIFLGYLKDKIRKRILQWEGRFLSKPDKDILIKTIAQLLPSYAMNVFLIPLNICQDMERLMA